MIKVSTGRLRDGNVIHVQGAVIRIEGKPEIIFDGRRTWYAWRNMPIIRGSLDGLPEATRWTVQGDDGCFWRVS